MNRMEHNELLRQLKDFIDNNTPGTAEMLEKR